MSFLTHQELGLTNSKRCALSRVYASGHNLSGILFTSPAGSLRHDRLKDPKFITGYGGPEPILRSCSARLTRVNAGQHHQTLPDWIEKGLVNFHAGIRCPKGDKHPRYAQLPDLRLLPNPTQRKVMQMVRAFRLAPKLFLPGHAKERVQTLQEAMRKTLQDPEFEKDSIN
jgi:hypothetical protein